MREDESEGADILLVGFVIYIYYDFVFVIFSQTLKKNGFAGKTWSPLFGYHKAAKG